MSRLFYALNPDRNTRKQLLEVQARSEIDVRRLVPAKNLHMTLLFLGNVDDENRSKLIDITDNIELPRFTLRLSKSGWWKRSQIMWLAPQRVPKQLQQLVNALGEVAKQCKIPVQERRYKAHITLARKVSSPQPLGFTPIRWNIREFCLFNSSPVRGGVEYNLIRSWPLS